VTGGAGFIGGNLTAALVRGGSTVTVLDNLQRAGADANLRWLRGELDGELRVLEADVRDADALARAIADVDVVYHLAGQTAVTTSVLDPRGDFEANALGTLNVLEAARRRSSPPTIVYASTNKVYGDLERLPVLEEPTRYRFRDLPHGVDETHTLEFHSPYGCSKGVADQYVLDYARIYGLPTVVFRQSCVYGPRQLGSAEQGWVAWLTRAAAFGRPITIFGTGKQVRDLLYVDDLVDAYLLATDAIDRTTGNAYNIGGGSERAVSIWHEFAPLLGAVLEHELDPPSFEDPRPGDQRVFVCDSRKAAADFGWRPQVAVRAGLARLASWVLENERLFAASPATR
jgi:CDP-paratose 2-epimerase